MKCEICGRKSDSPGTVLYRVNAVGVLPAIWRCPQHLETPVDPDLRELVDVLARYGSSNSDEA